MTGKSQKDMTKTQVSGKFHFCGFNIFCYFSVMFLSCLIDVLDVFKLYNPSKPSFPTLACGVFVFSAAPLLPPPPPPASPLTHHTLTHTHTHTITYTLTHSSHNHLHTHSLTHSLTHSVTYTHSLTHTHTHHPHSHTLDKKWSIIGSVGNWIPSMQNQTSLRYLGVLFEVIIGIPRM